MSRIALGLAASAAIAFASPASAAVTVTDYSFTGSGGATGLNGTFSLAFDDVTDTYSLDDLSFVLGATTFDTSNAGLDPFGSGLILFGSLINHAIQTGTDDFWIILAPAAAFPQTSDAQFTLASDCCRIHVGPILIDTVEAAVPEPSTWAMMLLGFGAAGLAFRRARPRQLANAIA